MPKPKVESVDDLLGQLVTGLRSAAIRPNVLSYKPHAKQEIFHQSPKKGRLYIGGNRSGKTTAGCVEGILRLMGTHPTAKPPFNATPERPIRGRVIGVDFPAGIDKILLPEYARWTPTSALKGGSWDSAYRARTRTLSFANGSFVEFMSYDQELDSFAGTSRDFVHFDEEPPEEVFNENTARLIDTGGPWWMTMTPVEGMTWIYDKIYIPGSEGKVDHIKVVEAKMDENPHISQSEIDLYLNGLDKDERRARGEGKFIQMGGLVFKGFDQKVHVLYPDDEGFVDMGELKLSSWKWFCSLDHGFNNPTAVLWHAVNSNGVVITFAEHYQAEWTVDEHAKEIHKRNQTFGRKPDVYVCDPALAQRNGVTGTSIHTEYAQRGLPFALGNNDVASGIVRMNEYLRAVDGVSHWYIYGICINLIKEIQRLRWKTYASKKIGSKNNKSELIHKKDDHACDSARYMFTMMPDLTPDQIAKPRKKNYGAQLGAVESRPAFEPVYDEGLIKSNKTIWRPALDEYMGGIF